MIEYRKARPEEEPAVLDFINMVFSMTVRPHQFAKLLEKVYGRPGYSQYHYVAVRDDGSIRGTVALLPMTLHPTPDTTLRIGYVGSVSVHPSDRHAGHMKALMSLMLSDARARGFDLLLLGGQRQRYRYNGFERGAASVNFQVTANNVRHDLGDVDISGLTVRPVDRGDDTALDAIAALSVKRGFFADRPRKDLAVILSSWYQEIRVLADGADRVLGYLTLSGDHISEFAFEDPADLKAALKCLLAGRKSVTVSVPLHDRANFDLLHPFAEHWELRNTEMINVLDWPLVLRTLLSVKNEAEKLPEGRMVFSVDGTVLAVQVGADSVSVEETDETPDRTLSGTEAVSLFFSVDTALLEPSPLLRAWLPLPLSLADADHF